MSSGTVNWAGPRIVRLRTEGLGGGRRWSVGLGGEGGIVGYERCGERGNAQGVLGRSFGCRWEDLLEENVGGVG